MHVVDDGPQGQLLWGRPMLEVFSVRYENLEEQCQGHLYGEIKISDKVVSRQIYNRNRGNPESVSPGDIVSLTGPAQSLIAYDRFIIYVNLVCVYNNRLLVEEAISSHISWSSYETASKYDMPLSGEIRGLFGFVTVNYVVLRNAVSAIVEVKLINRDKEKENSTNVYGTLAARNSKFLDGSVESLLFCKKMGEEIDVRPGQLIPLSRSLVAVPSDSSLIIEANLCDSFIDMNVEGIAEFPAQLTGTSERDISYEYGGIIVKVTWVT